MADIQGTAFSSSDPAALAPGTSHDAGTRRHRNTVSLATEGGGGQNAFIAAKVREGNCISSASFSADVNLSAINFTLGTDADNAKYGAAFAGPAANAHVAIVLKVSALAMDPLDKPETIKLYPSGALPAAGLLVASVFTSKR